MVVRYNNETAMLNARHILALVGCALIVTFTAWALTIGPLSSVPTPTETGRVTPHAPQAIIDFAATLQPDAEELRDVLSEFQPEENSGQQVSYQAFDLNGDGARERFFYISGASSCGTGNCAIRVFSGPYGARPPIFEISSGPLIYVVKTKTNGFFDLATPMTGERAGEFRIWRWNGQTYD
ncbi:hypothetical protein M9M90_00965 [Phenylobacterium sp. LH3H17]|uniref:hypothetical protein n=1 Tax=Phenylobacterium sp. LH3H17 TaxID=2903901 RepID=UPI0020C98C0C|nr:hypothetical protein [Phenylobacterium sp. LH3H17]UTP39775.1 hypothetical protein M9M90_00965 [Phenylobacterium sp. LH3H17]